MRGLSYGTNRIIWELSRALVKDHERKKQERLAKREAEKKRAAQSNKIHSVGSWKLKDDNREELLKPLRAMKIAQQAVPRIRTLSGTFVFVFLALAVAFLVDEAAGTGMLIFGYPLILSFTEIISKRAKEKMEKVELTYEFATESDRKAYEAFTRQVLGLTLYSSVWAYTSYRVLSPYEAHQSGVKASYEKEEVISSDRAPRGTVANVTMSSLSANGTTLYFTPEYILMYDDAGIGCIEYSDLTVETGSAFWVLSAGEFAPRGSEPAGHSWQHQKANGEPDLRFRDNEQRKRRHCGELKLSIPQGVLFDMQVGSPKAPEKFAKEYTKMVGGE